MCVSPTDLIDSYQIRTSIPKGMYVDVRYCDPVAGDDHEDSLPDDIIGAEGVRPILEYTTSGAAPTSPPEGGISPHTTSVV